MTRYFVPGLRTPFVKAGRDYVSQGSIDLSIPVMQAMTARAAPRKENSNMQQSNSAKSDQRLAKPPKEAALTEEHTSLEERSHVFEDRHWVNEACGDDLWET